MHRWEIDLGSARNRRTLEQRKAFDVEAFEGRIRRAFPKARLSDYWIDFQRFDLRYELGDKKPCGTTERIGQAVDRAVKLFESINRQDEDIVVVCKDFDGPKEMFPSRPPRYLLSLISGYDPALGAEYTIAPDEYCSVPYQQIVYPTKVRSLAYAAIFRGIANSGLGRSPCIGARVYLVNVKRMVVFYMYDDQGCLIFADKPKKLVGLYAERNAWLVDSYRSRFDDEFRDLAVAHGYLAEQGSAADVVSQMLRERDKRGPRLGKGTSIRALRSAGRRR
jgi:hypothetical protein